MYSPGYFPIPGDEALRLARIDDYEIVDRGPERELDRITQLAAKLFDVPMCAISIIGKDTQWFASRQGVDLASTPRDAAFCSRTIMADDPLVVLDATQDAAFKANPLVTGKPGIRFYAGAPLIVEDDVHLGALCLMDERPHARFDAEKRALLHELAAVVAESLVRRREESRNRRRRDEESRALTDERSGLIRETERIAAQQSALGELVGAIDALTKEARMLALNSAIEAARHGREGQAFAAIAGEIGKLVSNSQAAAARARALLSR